MSIHALQFASLNWATILTGWAAPVVVLAVGLVATTWVGSWVVGRLASPFATELETAKKIADDFRPLKRGFENGGRIIGMLERFLIFLFVLSNQLAGVGFLVAAKSVFRFGELSSHENRMEAEYIIIGTLLSFSWGLLISLLTRMTLAMLIPLT